MSPAEAAAEASARASELIAISPHLIDVLDWHQGLCGSCSRTRKCAEYGEIVSEYGAGEYGVTVFYPDCTAQPGGMPGSR